MIPAPLPTDRTRDIEADYLWATGVEGASVPNIPGMLPAYIRLYAEARREIESLTLSLQSWQRFGRGMVAPAKEGDPGGYYAFGGYAGQPVNHPYEG